MVPQRLVPTLRSTPQPRAWALAVPTQVLLTSGGDDRQVVKWDHGINSYGVAPRPMPWTSLFGSCTASSPTYRAFDAASQLKYRLIEAALADRLEASIQAETNLIRSTILAALGVAPDLGVEVVLTPSGTDAELVALAISLRKGAPIRSIVVGPTEIGRGSIPAASGRHFSPLLPSGRATIAGEAVVGFDSIDLSVVEVPIRDDSGAMLPPESVEDQIDAELTAAPDRVLLHVLEGSKTGIRLPHADAVDHWQRREGNRLDVVIDAAQMRIDQDTVVSHLANARMVFVTGSKFFGGPPFSGALLVPRELADDLRRTDRPLPGGLSDYLSQAEVPDTLSTLRDAARPGVNFGLLARWAAALAEMRSFHNASKEIRDEILRILAAGFRQILTSSPYVEIVESPYTPIPDHDQRGLDDLPTIFTFLVRNPSGGYLDFDQAKMAQQLLTLDVGDRLGMADEAPQVARRSFQLGQPVEIALQGDRWIAGLRFAIGATTISRIVFDYTRGESSTDRVKLELAEIQDALAKLGLIVEQIDLEREESLTRSSGRLERERVGQPVADECGRRSQPWTTTVLPGFGPVHF